MSIWPVFDSEFVPEMVSFNSSIDEISSTIQSTGSTGILTVKDLPCDAPLESIGKIFDVLRNSAGIGEMLNAAYTRNLVYKDSFASGSGRPTVDMKRVLDLSPERMAVIAAGADEKLTDLLAHDGIAAPFDTTLSFWQTCTSVLAPKMLQALAKASGSEGVLDDVYFNYRMVDYYERPVNTASPRCGEHRDFGTMTIIFSDQPGLEVQVDGEWRPLKPASQGAAHVVFGWCTEIRSNGRVSACLHRVSDSSMDGGDVIPRRLAAVLFVAPKHGSTRLDPVILPGEVAKYHSIGAGELRGNMARKWKRREGTVTVEEMKLEEEEVRNTGMLTQDHVVQRMVRV